MGTWGPRPFENDTALDFVSEHQSVLVGVIDEFLEAPALEDTFARAFAALELLNALAKIAPTAPPVPAEIDRWTTAFLTTFDREMPRYTTDTEFQSAQRDALENALTTLKAHANEFYRGAPGTPSSALSRRLERAARNQASGDFIFNYGELAAWVAPYGDDIAKAWGASVRGDHLLAIAQAIGVPASELQAIVAAIVRPALARLPADAPSANDAEALEEWSTKVVGTKREALPLAAVARAAAHVARAKERLERDHLGLAISELLKAAKLDASVAAEKRGMSWMDAMTSTDGPGWAADRARNAEIAEALRAALPIARVKLA